ncbi:hypothetical protein D9M71_669540 [compost metagenome]
MVELPAHRVEHVRVAVAEDHRAPGADVVDVALVVFIHHVGAFRVLEEQRRAADALERADRGVDAAGDVLLGVGEQGFGTGHGNLADVSEFGRRPQSAWNRALKARARRSTSAAESAANSAWITASRSAPRPISSGALSMVTPPMATSGRPKRLRACSSRSTVAAGAPGLVWELKKRPKAM